ncbi:MAG: hypothetical protein ABH831_01150 [Candidatus Nealsonbacteria bacterium]
MPDLNDKSGFGGKKYLSRTEFRQWLKNRDLYSLGMSEQERLLFEEEMAKNYGSYLDKGELTRIIGKLRTEKSKSLIKEERQKIDRKMRLLQKFLGN